MLSFMRRFTFTILFSVFALSAIALFAQDDLAQYQTWMKTAAGASRKANQAITAKDTAAAATEAGNMAAAFDSIATFWKAKGNSDAQNFAETARDAGKAAAAATTSDAQAAALQPVQATCNGCHAATRAGNNFK